MKIFNWVHRRFNNKAENVKNSDDIGGEDQQFPAENKCNHVFERWRGGILAIGTLGYDPLKDEDQQLNDYFYRDVVVSCEQEYQRDSDDDDDDDESSDDFGEEEVESDEEEENPLVVAAYSCNAGGLMREAEEMEENWKHEFEYVMMEKKERTTLADLFHADSQDHNDDVVSKKQAIADLSKEKSNRKRRRLLFRNNLMAKDARPIHKLNQLMRRMLKRKIHPDVGPINPKVAAVNSINSHTTDDYASLLRTRELSKRVDGTGWTTGQNSPPFGGRAAKSSGPVLFNPTRAHPGPWVGPQMPTYDDCVSQTSLRAVKCDHIILAAFIFFRCKWFGLSIYKYMC